jgi:hypothetical protein
LLANIAFTSSIPNLIELIDLRTKSVAATITTSGFFRNVLFTQDSSRLIIAGQCSSIDCPETLPAIYIVNIADLLRGANGSTIVQEIASQVIAGTSPQLSADGVYLAYKYIEHGYNRFGVYNLHLNRDRQLYLLTNDFQNNVQWVNNGLIISASCKLAFFDLLNLQQQDRITLQPCISNFAVDPYGIRVSEFWGSSPSTILRFWDLNGNGLDNLRNYHLPSPPIAQWFPNADWRLDRRFECDEFHLPDGALACGRYSPNRRVVVGTLALQNNPGDDVLLWFTETWSATTIAQVLSPRGFDVFDVHYSNDTSRLIYLATECYTGTCVHVGYDFWEITVDPPVLLSSYRGVVRTFVIGADNSVIIIANDSEVQILHTSTSMPIVHVQPSYNPVERLLLSDDGRLLFIQHSSGVAEVWGIPAF